MTGRLEGRVGLVTGAAAGLGKAFADALEAEGATVARNDLPATGAPYPADVRDYGAVGRVVGDVLRDHGRLDLVVSNAGIERLGFIDQLDESDWRDTIGVHVFGAFNLLRHCTPILKAQGSGSVVVISSAGSFTPTVRHSPYGAAKAALFSLAYKASLDLRSHGVRVNCIWPGLALTGLVEHFADDWRASGYMSAEEREQFLAAAADPAELTPLVVYLCTDEASSITGCTFAIGRREIRLVHRPSQSDPVTADGPSWTLDDVARVLPGLAAQEQTAALGMAWSQRVTPLDAADR